MKIRTLGFYPPFGSLMLHGKIETRWVREGMRPPFPLGKYLFYHTEKTLPKSTLIEWQGEEMNNWTDNVLQNERTLMMLKTAIATGELFAVSKLLPEEENGAFVKYIGRKIFIVKDKNGNEKEVPKIQWGLHFDNVQRIAPFKWNFGKQGVGFVPDSELEKIIIPVNS